MSKEKKKMGRPIIGKEPRTEKLNLRLSKSELKMINECSEKLKTPRVNVIVKGVNIIYEELNKE